MFLQQTVKQCPLLCRACPLRCISTIEIIFKGSLHHGHGPFTHLNGFIASGDPGIDVCRQFQQGITCYLRTFRTTLRVSGMCILAYRGTQDVLDGNITTELYSSGFYWSGSHVMILCQIHVGGVPCKQKHWPQECGQCLLMEGVRCTG
ncbi:MAG TPA: hypothetical protein DCO71_07020 [Gammaproteobacteria bacterium]|nr:hypothetical protein [Gammaproteobacteria bacterium]